MSEKSEKQKIAPELPDFDKLWDYDHPKTTEQKFRELLPAAVDSLNVPYFLSLLTQIARSEGLQRKFLEAHRTLDNVEGSLSKADDTTKVRYLLERGRVFNSSGNADTARPLFLEAYNLALQTKLDLYGLDAAHMMAIVEPPEKQTQWNMRALDIAEHSDDERARRWKGSLYNNMGVTYLAQNEYQEALYMFEKALEFRQQEGNPNRIRPAKWSVAKTLRLLGHTEEALEMQQQLYQENEAIGEKSGFVYEEIAECLLIMGEEEQATAWFAAAYNELSKDPWLANDQNRINRLKELGRVETQRPL